ncbi:MAG: hypothetical protein IPL26_09805 [Leptospiraceae bacterium]|nr:hypothetical protein [Leptospiraceae bacterium]
MKIKLWIIGVSLVFVQGCTGVLLSSLNSKSGDGSSGLMNLLVLLGLGGAAGGSSSGNGSAATVNYTPVANYDLSSGIPAGWTGTWTSTSSNCPVTGTAPCLVLK